MSGIVEFYITKRLGRRNGAPVLYLPKDWNITPDKDVTFIFWDTEKAKKTLPYKLRATPKKMNNEGAVGIYMPNTYMDVLPENGLITFRIITDGEESDGDA